VFDLECGTVCSKQMDTDESGCPTGWKLLKCEYGEEWEDLDGWTKF